MNENPSSAFRRASRLVVFDSSGRLLLFQYEDRQGSFWATPGGGLEEHEDFAQAAAREAQEELGISRVELAPLWETTADYEARGRRIHQLERFFLAKAACDAVIVEGQSVEHRREGIRTVRWWILEELRNSGERIFPEDLWSRLNEAALAR